MVLNSGCGFHTGSETSDSMQVPLAIPGPEDSDVQTFFYYHETPDSLLQWVDTTILGDYFSLEQSMKSGASIYLTNDSDYIFSSHVEYNFTQDIGSFILQNDTLYLTSDLNRTDSAYKDHQRYISLTGRKYLLRGHRIYFELKNGKFNPDKYWEMIYWKPEYIIKPQ